MVLVEDDPLVQQLLAMVWDDFVLDLVPCTRVAEALAALQAAPADLVVTDLMLPGASGLDLLERLAAEPALRGAARVAVFSAGIDARSQARLQRLGVWRVLRKPLPVADLQDCVLDAGARWRPGVSDALPPAEVPPVAPQPAAPREPAEGRAIDTHFGGNQALFDAFRDAALRQFTHDIAAGDAALQAQQVRTMQHLAHSLKSVLPSLGHATFGQLAAALEASAAMSDWRAVRPQWQALRRALAELARPD